MKIIEISDKEYKVKEAKTEKEKEKGLMEITELPDNEGMLFYFDKPQKVSFWMKNTKIPLDIIFINKDEEIISIKLGIPDDETPIIEENVKYVLELNVNSGVNVDDNVDLNPDDNGKYVMKVLAPDGSVQMRLEGGERIFSRKNTKVLIKLAKKAYSSLSDSDYKRLGKSIFKYLSIQDNNEPEYVESPN